MDELDSKMKTLVINESNINENNDNKNNNSDTLLKIIEIGSLVIMYLPTIEDILSLFSISNQFNSRMLIPLEILERTIEQLFREKFRNRYDYLERNLVPPFQVDLPSYPCTLKDLKNCHLVIKSIKCCFCLRAMFDSFSKVTSVAIEKESENDPPSYILKISVGTNDRKVCLSITGSFCDGDVDEPVNGDCFTIDAAECSFCETVNCGYCGDYVVCSACKASICGSCDEFVRCSCCNEIVCSNCDPSYVVCEGCNAFFCEDCQYEQSCQQCSYCESSFCEECTDQDANACVQCGGFYCGNCDGDYQICNDCGQCICNICFEDGDSVCCKVKILFLLLLLLLFILLLQQILLILLLILLLLLIIIPIMILLLLLLITTRVATNITVMTVTKRIQKDVSAVKIITVTHRQKNGISAGRVKKKASVMTVEVTSSIVVL